MQSICDVGTRCSIGTHERLKTFNDQVRANQSSIPRRHSENASHDLAVHAADGA